MGTAGCHLPCFVPEDSTKWHILFYHDVAPHQQHICPKRGIAKILLLAVRYVMYQQHVDLGAGDINGAWRRQSGSGSRFTSSIEEAFVNTNLPFATWPFTIVGSRRCTR